MKQKNILITLICLLVLALSLSSCTSAEETGGASSAPQSTVSQSAGTSALSPESESGLGTSATASETSAAPSEPTAVTSSQAAATSSPSSPAAVSLPDSPTSETPTAEPASSPPTATSSPAVNRITVTLSVDCHTAVAEGYQAAIDTAEDGEILSPTTVMAQEGITAYDLLLRSGLEVEADTTIMGKYVRSIQELGEKDCGNASGWLYSVNGEFPGISCGKYVLSDGDVVCWRYTCQNGADLT